MKEMKIKEGEKRNMTKPIPPPSAAFAASGCLEAVVATWW